GMERNAKPRQVARVVRQVRLAGSNDLVRLGLGRGNPGQPQLGSCQILLPSPCINPSDCRSRPGKNLIEAGMVHITDVFGYSSITIHEDGSMHYAPTNSRAARQTSSTVTPSIQR